MIASLIDCIYILIQHLAELLTIEVFKNCPLWLIVLGFIIVAALWNISTEDQDSIDEWNDGKGRMKNNI